MIGTDETMEMTLAKGLKPIISKQAYEGDAKAGLARPNVGAGDYIMPLFQ